MDKLKQWIALTAVGVMAVLAAGWFLLVSPQNSQASDLKAQAVTQQNGNTLLRTELATLKAQAKDLPAQQAVLARAAAKLPDNPALPNLIRALDKAAAAAGVELVSLAPAPPAPLTPAAGGAPAAQPPAPSAPAGASAANQPAAASGVTLKQIQLTLNVVGGYFQVEQFLDSLENLTRALKVTGFSLAPGDNPLKPLPAAPAGGAAPASSGSVTGKSLAASITGEVFMTSAAAPAAVAPVPVPAK